MGGVVVVIGCVLVGAKDGKVGHSVVVVRGEGEREG